MIGRCCNSVVKVNKLLLTEGVRPSCFKRPSLGRFPPFCSKLAVMRYCNLAVSLYIDIGVYFTLYLSPSVESKRFSHYLLITTGCRIMYKDKRTEKSKSFYGSDLKGQRHHTLSSYPFVIEVFL